MKKQAIPQPQIVRIPDYKPLLISGTIGLAVVSLALIFTSCNRLTAPPHDVTLDSIWIKINGTSYWYHAGGGTFTPSP